MSEYTTELSRAMKIGIAVDKLINTIFNGWPDMTFSARCYRWHLQGKRDWPMKIVDAILFWQDYNHCEMAYASELERIHIPEDMRNYINENF